MKEDLKEPLQLLSKRCRSRDLIKQQDWDGFHKLLTKVEKAMIADGRGDNSHSASNQSFGITGSALFVMTVASKPFVTPMNVLSTGFGPSTFQPKRSTGAPYQQPLGNSQPPSPSQSSAEVPESIWANDAHMNPVPKEYAVWTINGTHNGLVHGVWMNLEDKTLKELNTIKDANKHNTALICTYALCADNSHARKIKFMCPDTNCQRKHPLGQYVLDGTQVTIKKS